MSWADDDFEEDFDFEGADEKEEQEDEEEDLLQRIEQAFRGERARIRGCGDLDELRALRAAYASDAAGSRLNQAGRIRARDLIELIDDRVTDLKAQRIAARRG